MQAYGNELHPKGQGRVASYGTSIFQGSSDAECSEIHTFFADCDGLADWHPVHTLLSLLNIAHTIHARNDTNWHLNLWYASTLKNPHAGDTDKTAAWKQHFYRPFYGALLGFFSELFGLPCLTHKPNGDPSSSLLGFDAKTDRLLNLQYPPCRRKPADPPATVVFHNGLALDPFALLADLGLLPSDEPPPASTRRRSLKTRSLPETKPRSPRTAFAPPQSDEDDEELISALAAVPSDAWRKGRLDLCARSLGGSLGASGYDPQRAATIVANAASRAGCGAHAKSMMLKARKAASRAATGLPVPRLGRLKLWFPDLYDVLLPRLPLLQQARIHEQQYADRLLAPADATATFRAALSFTPGSHLFTLSPGSGKTLQLLDVLASSYLPAALFSPTHALAEQQREHLRLRGIDASASKSVTRLHVLNNDGLKETLCKQLHLADLLAPLGGARQLLCPSCSFLHNHPLSQGPCPAYHDKHNSSDARIQIHMHVRLPDVLADLTLKLLEQPDNTDLTRTVVVDEALPLVDECLALAPGDFPLDDLFARLERLLDSDVRETLGPLWTLARCALSSPSDGLSLRSLLALASDNSTDVEHTLALARSCSAGSFFSTHALQSAARLALEDDDEGGEPRLHIKRLRALSAWLRALAEAAHSPDEPFLLLDSFDEHTRWFFSHRARWCREARAFLGAGGSLTFLDATADPDALAAALGTTLHTTTLDVRDAPGILRRHIDWASAARRYLVHHDGSAKPKELRGALRDLARQIEDRRKHGLPAQRVGLLTHRPIALALQEAFDQLRASLRDCVDGGSPFDALPELLPLELARLLAEGLHFELGYFGAQRGLDKWADCHVLATLGNPWPNVGAAFRAARVLGLDQEKYLHHQLQAELIQAHGRARTVHRKEPLLLLHYGIEPDLDMAPQWAAGAGGSLVAGRPGRQLPPAVAQAWPATPDPDGPSQREQARRLQVPWGTWHRWASQSGPPQGWCSWPVLLEASNPPTPAGVPAGEPADVPADGAWVGDGGTLGWKLTVSPLVLLQGVPDPTPPSAHWPNIPPCRFLGSGGGLWEVLGHLSQPLMAIPFQEGEGSPPTEGLTEPNPNCQPPPCEGGGPQKQARRNIGPVRGGGVWVSGYPRAEGGGVPPPSAPQAPPAGTSAEESERGPPGEEAGARAPDEEGQAVEPPA